jgi:thiosulfate/3-mercaptopyruvate sulfurtransferase
LSSKLKPRLWALVAAIPFVLSLVLGCAGPSGANLASAPKSAKEAGYANPDLLADTAWLADHLDDPKVRIVDVRKAGDYAGGHIKNSVNVDGSDPKGRLYDQEAKVKWTVLTKEQIEGLMGELGVGNETTVVVLDDARGLWAARFFWTLEYYGHANGKVRVLNGGIQKWKVEKRDLTTETTKIQKATFTAKADPTKIATKQQILDGLNKKNATILATIPEAEFKGGNSNSAARGGHIPGALRLDWVENLIAGDVPLYKSEAELAKQYSDAGITKDKNLVVY